MRPKLIPPTDAEDAAIRAGIESDPDTFEPTDEDFTRMRPASEAVPELLTDRRRGRPAPQGRKESVTIRYDREVLAAFRATGPGWQSRMNAALKEWLAAHK